MKIMRYAALLLVAGCGLWMAKRTFWKSALREAPPVAVAERKFFEVSIEASGDIQPIQQVEVKTEVSGKVKSLSVKVAAMVERGQEIACIDDTELISEKAGVQTEVDGAKVELCQAQREHDRASKLFQKKLISQEAYDEAQSGRDLKKSQFERMRRKMQLVEDRLAKTVIRAPMSGTVLSLPVVEGQVVIAAASVNAGTTLMTLADLSLMRIVTHINQVDIVQIRQGHPVQFTVDSLPAVPMSGEVTVMAPLASVKNNVKGFEVEIVVRDFDPRVRPGMSADLKFVVVQVPDALVVPLTSVFGTPEAGNYVLLKNGAKFDKHPVKVGRSNFDYAEIISGLSEGQQVSLTRLPDGAGGKGPKP